MLDFARWILHTAFAPFEKLIALKLNGEITHLIPVSLTQTQPVRLTWDRAKLKVVQQQLPPGQADLAKLIIIQVAATNVGTTNDDY